MKPRILALVLAFWASALELSAQTPRIQFELGFLRTWHADDAVTRRDWIQVPGTWRDPATLPGQSQYAFTFRDTTWAYRFNHNHPMFTTRIRLGAKPDARWQCYLIQSAMWNSWHQLSFMLGGEAELRAKSNLAPRPSGWRTVRLPPRAYARAARTAFRSTALTAEFSQAPTSRSTTESTRAGGCGSPETTLLLGLGLFYAWSPKPDPAPRT